MLKCHSCEDFYGVCNDCEVRNMDTVGPEGIKGKFYQCGVCKTRICYNCKLA